MWLLHLDWGFAFIGKGDREMGVVFGSSGCDMISLKSTISPYKGISVVKSWIKEEKKKEV